MDGRRTSAKRGAQKSGVAPDAGLRTRGSTISTQITREAILHQARIVLTREGYARVTLRHLAELTGIAVGNVTYHFPSKRELFRALMAKLLDDYSRQFDELFRGEPENPGEHFFEIVRWLLEDAATPDTSRLFRELWTMSLHDDVVAQGVTDFYNELIGKTAGLLRRSRPHLDEQTALEIVQVIGLMSEGTSVIYGTGAKRLVPVKRTIERVMQILDQVTAPGNRRPTRSGR